jgi:hypothetical protein
MRLKSIAVLVLVSIFAISSLMAQDAPKAEKYDNPVWYSMTHVKYKPGKLDEAMEMIREHFEPASMAAGTPSPAMVLVNHSGEWDLTIIWKMKGGLSAMEWKTSPDNVKWMKALKEHLGGDGKMEEVMGQYQSLIQNSSTVIGRHMPFGEKSKG